MCLTLGKKSILLIGRWSPFHNGHKYLVDSYLNSGTPVCIAIRRSKEKYNPYQRMHMISAVYKKEISAGKVDVIIIPDILGIAVGRDVGYFISKVPEEIESISGTKIRESNKLDDLPEEVRKVLNNWKDHKEGILKI